MTEQQTKVVLKVLRDAYHYGLFYHHWASGYPSGLPRWKRFINWLLRFADQPPFLDPNNYDRFLKGNIPEKDAVELILKELTGTPRCRKCGSTELAPDPAGYYEDAVRWDGAPLLCWLCEN